MRVTWYGEEFNTLLKGHFINFGTTNMTFLSTALHLAYIELPVFLEFLVAIDRERVPKIATIKVKIFLLFYGKKNYKIDW